MTTKTVVWHGWPHAPAPREALPGWLPGRTNPAAGPSVAPARIDLVDDAWRPVPLGRAGQLRELLRIGWLALLTQFLRALAWLVVPRRLPQPTATQPGPGPVVLVLPVLPDLSHTFVYREVLALLAQRPDWRVVVLARNERAPVHAEARALRAHATFVPRDGITRAGWRSLCWLLRANGRALCAEYRAAAGTAAVLVGKHPLRDARHPGNVFRLADLLRTWRPRHVHVYSSTWPANVGLGAARLLGVPASISSYVDFEFDYLHRMLAGKLRQATFFRVVTKHCRQQLLALPDAGAIAARVPVVYLGLDLVNWPQRTTPPHDGTLVSAARLVPKKGLHVVPPALARLRTRGVRCRWRVIGDGPELAALQQACREHGVEDLATFLGPRDNATVRDELAAADLAVLPCVLAADGERDGIPIFLCEAMALGVAVVTTPVSGIPELVHDGDTGFLCAPGDSAALADTLARALGDPAATAAVAARGRARVHAVLDVDRLAAELVAEIER
jgi:glycosyltransferase involved in cell wall biosynthesis